MNRLIVLAGWLTAGLLPAQAAPPGPPGPSESGGLRLEAELSLSHEASSSPLIRVSDDGALVALPELSRLAGTVRRASLNASADGRVAGDGRWAATGLVESRQSGDAPGLAFRLALADLSLRWPLAGGTVGIGPSWLSMTVAGQAFRQTAAAHLDWTRVPTDGPVQALRLEVARHRHAANFEDLDAEVVAPSGHWHWATPGHGLGSFELGWGLRRERNRRGLPELSNHGAHLMGELAWDAWHTSWAINLMLQRSVFGGTAGSGLPARRDTFVAVDLSTEWPVTEQLALRASIGRARNHARPWLFENRHHHAELTLSGRW